MKTILGVHIPCKNVISYIFRKHCFDKMARGKGKENDSVDKIGKK